MYSQEYKRIDKEVNDWKTQDTQSLEMAETYHLAEEKSKETQMKTEEEEELSSTESCSSFGSFVSEEQEEQIVGKEKERVDSKQLITIQLKKKEMIEVEAQPPKKKVINPRKKPFPLPPDQKTLGAFFSVVKN